jgi:hypothetical protein
MRLIDADKYQKELLSAYDDVSMEFEVLDRQPLVSAIPIPEGATNGDMIKAIFDIPDSEIDEGLSTTYIYTSKRVLKGGSQDYLRKQITFSRDWWNAPYKGGYNLSEKPTGSESEDKE